MGATAVRRRRHQHHQNHGRIRALIPAISAVSCALLFLFAFLSILAPSPTDHEHLRPLLRRHVFRNGVEKAGVSVFRVPTSGGRLDRDLWKSRLSKFYYGCINASKKFPEAKAMTHPKRYLLIATSGGLNQQRTGITDAVVAARILNASLVIPKLDQKSFWKDASNFSDIFDVDWFISSLSKDVKIIKELPRRAGKIWAPYTMRVPRKCSERCYQIRVLPNLLKKHVSCYLPQDICFFYLC